MIPSAVGGGLGADTISDEELENRAVADMMGAEAASALDKSDEEVESLAVSEMMDPGRNPQPDLFAPGEVEDEYDRPVIVAVTPAPPPRPRRLPLPRIQPPKVGAAPERQGFDFVEALVRRDMPRAIAPKAGRRR